MAEENNRFKLDPGKLAQVAMLAAIITGGNAAHADAYQDNIARQPQLDHANIELPNLGEPQNQTTKPAQVQTPNNQVQDITRSSSPVTDVIVSAHEQIEKVIQASSRDNSNIFANIAPASQKPSEVTIVEYSDAPVKASLTGDAKLDAAIDMIKDNIPEIAAKNVFDRAMRDTIESGVCGPQAIIDNPAIAAACYHEHIQDALLSKTINFDTKIGQEHIKGDVSVGAGYDYQISPIATPRQTEGAYVGVSVRANW